MQVSWDLLKEHVYQHFKQLFGRKNNFRVHLKEGVWKNEVDLTNLDEEFWEEEIKRAVWELGKDKAPVSKGFLLFFKLCSEVIKKDLAWLMEDEFKGISILDRINYLVITLIPKKCSPRHW